MAVVTRPDLDRLTAAVDALGTAFAAIEFESLTSDMLKVASLQASRGANMIDGFRADLARRARDLAPPGAPPSRRNLDPTGQRPGRQPERDSSRSDLFDEFTELGEATRRGDLPGDYADTINQATARLSAAERAAFNGHYRDTLTTQALTMGLHEFRVHVRELVDDFCRASQLERFRQLCRKRTGKVWDDPVDGMTKLFAAFDPETGARIRKAIDDEIDRIHHAKRDDPNDTRTHQQIVADALANLILDARTNSTSSRTELIVLVDLHTLLHEHRTAAAAHPFGRGDRDAANTDGDVAAAATTNATVADEATAEPGTGHAGRCCETSDGTVLPIEVVRRLACGADILPAVLNGRGVVLDLGRSQRLATDAQRDALATMYARCAFEHCTVPFARCEIHHIDPWAPPTNGHTNLDKLVPTCTRHHHHIHDHHLQLSLDPATRTLTVIHPDGTREHHRFHDRRRPPPDADDLPRSA